ncbi:hypothetical protein ACFQVC_09685 [Streptomyces monticola]|uniref:TPM domain-containing protein n=1 Tax=Streptomyces monticola TaxID=2666263 RepID=A0ABW2JEM5_9ACTN
MSSDVRRLSSGVGRRLAGAVLAFAAAVAGPLTVACGTAAAADSPGQKIADALRKDPVYVDPSYAGAVRPQQRERLTRQIEKTELPIKVALVPLVKGDAFGGDPDVLARVVHDRLGADDLVLITTSDLGDWLSGYEWPGEKHQASAAVNAVGHLEEMDDAGLAARVAKAVELVDEGNGKKVYEDATADLNDPGPGSTDGSSGGSSGAGDTAASDDGFPWPAAGAGTGAVLLVGAVGYALRRRRRGGRALSAPGAPFASPQAVYAAARAADEAELRRRAEAEILALSEAVQEAETADASEESTARVLWALDAYDAANTVLAGARGVADLAGVLALVAEGRDALSGADAAGPGHPLCFFNPLHGRAVRRLRWRPLGRRRQLDVAGCAECVAAVRARRAPEVLTDRTDEGREVPYFEVPADRSVWAATGYGSLVRDGLAGRVARGDFSRGRTRE